jgi:hypothetical protein
VNPEVSEPPAAPTIFLLPPALLSGQRGRLLRGRKADFPAAVQLREAAGIPIAELFSFLSSLYFRGKIAYARRFASEHAETAILVIAPGFGLVPPEWPVTRERLRRLARTPVDPRRRSYHFPLRTAATALGERLPESARVVLLGSLASGKYIDILLPCLGGRLHFPCAFAGTGDMQRGSMMLTAARTGTELDYAPLLGTVRRPPPPAAPGSLATAATPGSHRWGIAFSGEEEIPTAER